MIGQNCLDFFLTGMVDFTTDKEMDHSTSSQSEGLSSSIKPKSISQDTIQTAFLSGKSINDLNLTIASTLR